MVGLFDFDGLSCSYFEKCRYLSTEKDTACKGNKVGNGMRAIFCYLDHYAVSWLKKAPGMHPVLFLTC